IRPSRTTSVFTEPARSADSSSSWQNGITPALCGVVTLAPAKPSAARPATASPSAAWSTGSGTYAQSSPRAAKAAFCIRGDSDPDTGSPSSPTSVVVPSIAAIGASIAAVPARVWPWSDPGSDQGQTLEVVRRGAIFLDGM